MRFPTDRRVRANRRRNRGPGQKAAVQLLRYRVEGLRRGRVMHVHVTGQPGSWQIYGPNNLKLQVAADTIDDVLRMTRKQLPFRPIAVRLLDEQGGSIGSS